MATNSNTYADNDDDLIFEVSNSSHSLLTMSLILVMQDFARLRLKGETEA